MISTVSKKQKDLQFIVCGGSDGWWEREVLRIKCNFLWKDKAMGVYVLSPYSDSWQSSNLNEQVSVYAGDGDDTIGGGYQNDYLDGGNGNDHLYGFDGNDFLNGLQGNDYLVGGNGNDTILGGDGSDRLYGDAGTDILNGGAAPGGGGVIGYDELYGGAGDDIYLHYNNDDGISWIKDSSGTGDVLIFNDSSIYDLVFLRENNNLIIESANDYSNGYNDNGVDISNYFGSGWTHGAGEIEFLQVGNVNYNLWTLLGLS